MGPKRLTVIKLKDPDAGGDLTRAAWTLYELRRRLRRRRLGDLNDSHIDKRLVLIPGLDGPIVERMLSDFAIHWEDDLEIVNPDDVTEPEVKDLIARI